MAKYRLDVMADVFATVQAQMFFEADTPEDAEEHACGLLRERGTDPRYSYGCLWTCDDFGGLLKDELVTQIKEWNP